MRHLSDYFLFKVKNGEQWDIRESLKSIPEDEVVIKVLDNDVTTYFYQVPRPFLQDIESDLTTLFQNSEGEPDYIYYICKYMGPDYEPTKVIKWEQQN